MSNPRLATKLLDKKGKSAALTTYKEAIRIKAYKDFLKENNIDLNKIKKVEDFAQLPFTDKQNYIKKYPIEDRIKFKMYKNYTIERSSGFSGEPNYWVRFSGQDDATEKRIVTLVDLLFNIKTKKTLMINTFALGTWIAGVKTARWFLNAANRKDLDLTVVNVGINLEESASIFKKFYKFYDQTIFLGYNPFIKQLLENLKEDNSLNGDHLVHVLMGGESVTENWRDYVVNLLGHKTEEFKSRVISGYGAADMGSDIGVEQPFSIMLRRAFIKNKTLREKYFGDSEFVPMMFQYSPAKLLIETTEDKEMVFTTNSGVPLVRYNLHDTGGTIPYLEALGIVEKEYGEDYVKKTLKPMPLPVVYLYGRSDATIHVVGLNLYIEHVKQAISDPDLEEFLSARFYAKTIENEKLDQEFVIVAEADDVKEAEKNRVVITQKFCLNLTKLNSEYEHLYNTNPKMATPRFEFISKEEFNNYSAKGIKINYIQK